MKEDVRKLSNKVCEILDEGTDSIPGFSFLYSVAFPEDKKDEEKLSLLCHLGGQKEAMAACASAALWGAMGRLKAEEVENFMLSLAFELANVGGSKENAERLSIVLSDVASILHAQACGPEDQDAGQMKIVLETFARKFLEQYPKAALVLSAVNEGPGNVGDYVPIVPIGYSHGDRTKMAIALGIEIGRVFPALMQAPSASDEKGQQQALDTMTNGILASIEGDASAADVADYLEAIVSRLRSVEGAPGSGGNV